MNAITCLSAIEIDCTAESAFSSIVDLDSLPRTFTGYGKIPAIVGAETKDGKPLREGSIRITRNSDGSTIYEMIDDLKPPFSWLVSTAKGHWDVSRGDSSTRVEWLFTFVPRNQLARLLLKYLIVPSFQQAQSLCLNNHKKLIEGSYSLAE